jgi:hypothetical protein
MLSLIKSKSKKRKERKRFENSNSGREGSSKKIVVGVGVSAGYSGRKSSDDDSLENVDADFKYETPTNVGASFKYEPEPVVYEPVSVVDQRDIEALAMMDHLIRTNNVAVAVERPPSRSDRPSSRNSERSSSVMSSSSRRQQPRLGVGHQQQQQQQQQQGQTYLFEDDPGIMSEVETSSTRFRRTSGGSANNRQSSGMINISSSSSSRKSRPRTSPNQVPRGYSVINASQMGEGRPSSRQSISDDLDPGIMSEVETSSTSRHAKRSSRSRNGGYSVNIGGGGGGSSGTAIFPKNQPSIVGKVSSTLFEEDPGIMSEAETSATSSRLRRTEVKLGMGGKGNVSDLLPVVRTPSKTLERPLGIVFLIYRGETKRALLPNEITSIITVKALFVRSFNKALTLDYLDSPRVNIYMHNNSKDLFHELLDLRDIRDRTILKVFEADSSGRGPGGLGPVGLPPITNAEEYLGGVPVPDNDYQRSSSTNRVHRTLPRNTFSSLDQGESLMSNLRTGPGGVAPMLGERSKTLGPGFMRAHRLNGSRVESGYISSPDGNYDFDSRSASLPLHHVAHSRFSSGQSYSGRYSSAGPANTQEAKEKMMMMEAQLSQLTGMVEKALKHKRLGKKQVSFDKSVTFNDEDTPPKQPSSAPQLPPTSNGHHAPPQGILTTSKRHNHHHNHSSSSSAVSIRHQDRPNPELHQNLRRLHRSARELKQEVRVLRRLTQLQSMAMKDLVQDTYLKLREACISFSSQNGLMSSTENLEHWRIAQDEELFSKELNDLLQSISELESKVEEVRNGVIVKKDKIMLQEVESMALVLSKCSKTVTQLRQAYPTLEANLKSGAAVAESTVNNKETDVSLMTEFLKRSSERLDNAWRRCKKLTGTLVTLKRLASVQEQRFHPGGSSSAASSDISLSPTPDNRPMSAEGKESTLDDLLDALQTYATKPKAPAAPTTAQNQINQLQQQQQPVVLKAVVKPQQSHIPPPAADSPKSSSTISSPTPARKMSKELINGDLVAAAKNKGPPPCPPPRPANIPYSKGAPPPPPPRTSSATSKPGTAAKNGQVLNKEEVNSINLQKSHVGGLRKAAAVELGQQSASGGVDPLLHTRQDVLETRHQELLSRQRQLQEQYQRLQEMQKKTTEQKEQKAQSSTLPIVCGPAGNSSDGEKSSKEEPLYMVLGEAARGGVREGEKDVTAVATATAAATAAASAVAAAAENGGYDVRGGGGSTVVMVEANKDGGWNDAGEGEKGEKQEKKDEEEKVGAEDERKPELV